MHQTAYCTIFKNFSLWDGSIVTVVYICTIIIYSHSKFHNNWLKTDHQSWLTSFMHAQLRLCKHLNFLLIYICTINIYSHFKFYNNWLKTLCHQSWLTTFMQTQSRLCKHLSFLLIYIFSLSLYTHISNFITIGWKHDVICHDWHNSCMNNHLCANIWVLY